LIEDFENSLNKMNPTWKRDGKKLNYYLLENALESYAFRQHNLSTSILGIKLVSHMLVDGSCQRISDALGLNLQKISNRPKGFLPYGLNYSISKDSIIFSGALESDINNSILVIQIIEAKSIKILREMRISGTDPLLEKSFFIKDKKMADKLNKEETKEVNA
jgi:hypothetical protein